MKPITVTFTCSQCDYSVQETISCGESVWPPDTMYLLGSEEDGELVCTTHYNEWREKYRRENPNGALN